jgi:hypothetical protein
MVRKMKGESVYVGREGEGDWRIGSCVVAGKRNREEEKELERESRKNINEMKTGIEGDKGKRRARM